MKMLIAVALMFGTSLATAEPGLYQEALKETLASDSLQTITADFRAFELNDIQIESTGEVDEFKITLFYADLQTAGGCYVDAKAKRFAMELVGQGGTGFETRYNWYVETKLGTCLR
jgi:hypothetical protein